MGGKNIEKKIDKILATYTLNQYYQKSHDDDLTLPNHDNNVFKFYSINFSRSYVRARTMCVCVYERCSLCFRIVFYDTQNEIKNARPNSDVCKALICF